MTTDPTPLQERIARAIHKDELDGEWAELLDVYRLEYLATAAAVLPIIAAEVRKGQADALREAAESTRPGVDMNPTTIDGNWDYMWWTRYLAGLDGMWRSRLREAADRIEKEG